MSSSSSILDIPHPASLTPFLHSSSPSLQSLLHHPDYLPIRTYSRIPKPSSGEDGYFANTLATSFTIPHVLTLRRRPHLLSALPATPPVWPAPTGSPTPIHAPDLFLLLDLATPGVSGHPSTAHGGVIATALDEAMSYAVALYAPETGPRLEGEGERKREDDVPPTPRGMLYTAQLDIRYKSPVAVPGYLVVRVKVIARVGRKFWVRAQALQPEDGKTQMRLTTDAMAFWMQTVPSL
ncbi:thioesterase family protein [Aspergillus sclerotiicarbonarius CBS 121057]|uniref:Thioesterase family protein n=1 Tax=Aspergillus sclerotiicarbonarius (strain CBS 121057 / IBT 28362) TaxID=1448318 RepID=A0A319EMH0_ASPSB|nr:thioesterase family protein [Aspergillus sclerotiicarbonarius CBS 121057]